MLRISYIPNAFTENEGPITDIAKLEYTSNKDNSVLTIPHTIVTLPNDEMIEIVSEFTKYGNRFTARQEKQKLCFVESSGNLYVHFRTLDGFEVMVFAEGTK